MAGLLRVTPPCELLEDPKPQWQRTYVVLGDHKAEAAFDFAVAQAVNGAGMCAIHQNAQRNVSGNHAREGWLREEQNSRDARGPLQAARDRQH